MATHEERIMFLENRVRLLRKAAKAFQRMNVCYRVGKHPSEHLMRECQRGTELLDVIANEREKEDGDGE